METAHLRLTLGVICPGSECRGVCSNCCSFPYQRPSMRAHHPLFMCIVVEPCKPALPTSSQCSSPSLPFPWYPLHSLNHLRPITFTLANTPTQHIYTIPVGLALSRIIVYLNTNGSFAGGTFARRSCTGTSDTDTAIASFGLAPRAVLVLAESCLRRRREHARRSMLKRMGRVE